MSAIVRFEVGVRHQEQQLRLAQTFEQSCERQVFFDMGVVVLEATPEERSEVAPAFVAPSANGRQRRFLGDGCERRARPTSAPPLSARLYRSTQ